MQVIILSFKSHLFFVHRLDNIQFYCELIDSNYLLELIYILNFDDKKFELLHSVLITILQKLIFITIYIKYMYGKPREKENMHKVNILLHISVFDSIWQYLLRTCDIVSIGRLRLIFSLSALISILVYLLLPSRYFRYNAFSIEA